MIKIVDRYDNGVYPTSFDVKAAAEVLNYLNHDDIMRMKRHSDVSSGELNDESTKAQFLGIAETLFGC